jgi:UDP-N-acetylglucosamine diphosphorylase / glucose-1-phosphate thymidylyltransferase / UDP-N-acetylgalactosamine diphosphorylase / glucosamine-1-phosphate N-acetyltransferase / galactosamine-1-phosphate N-acetyltransferase
VTCGGAAPRALCAAGRPDKHLHGAAMAELVGLIPAAGKGMRAYPHTATVPKSMLAVDGTPTLQRNLELLRDQLGIRDIRIVIGHHGEVIRRHFGDGGRFGVAITYVSNDRLDLELPYSVYLAGRGIETYCCMILADECYVGSNHAGLRAVLESEPLVVCGLMEGEYAKQVRKNYAVTLRDGRIVDLLEKPAVVVDRLMGTGTYVLHPAVFRRLEAAFAPDPEHGPRDWTTWLGGLAHDGARVVPFRLTGRYVNINSRDDLNQANSLVRDAAFERRRTSLVYVVDGEGDAALRSLAAYAEVAEVDEVVAVARRRWAALDALAALPKVRVVTPPTADAPIGALVRHGLDQATGNVLVLSYSDDTFAPGDVSKFLVYLRDADLVMGTRTTRQLIEQGTNMRGSVRAAHVFLAKLLQVLWWRFEYRFTDICCVYQAMWRSTYEAIRGELTASGVEVYPEIVVEVLRARRRIVEIPINYYNRDVRTDYVRSPYQSAATFARVVRLMLRKRFEELGRDASESVQ